MNLSAQRMYINEISNIPLLTFEEEKECGKNLKLFDEISFLKRIDLTYDVQEILDLDIIFLSLNNSNYKEIVNSLLEFFKNKNCYETYYLKLKKYKSISDKLNRPLNSEELRNNFNIEDRDDKIDSLDLLNQTKKYILYQSSFDKLFEHNLKLVVSIVRRSDLKSTYYLDLINEGNLGLRRAIQKYDYTCGRFSTYANSWILHRVQNYRNNNRNMVAGTTHFTRLVADFCSNAYKLEQKLGRKLSIEELSKELNIELEQAKEYLRYSTEVLSLDDAIKEIESEEFTFLDKVVDGANLEEEMIKKENAQEILDLLKILKDKNRKIIELRYGIGCKEHSLPSIAKKCGITHQGASYAISKSLIKLRKEAEKRKLFC